MFFIDTLFRHKTGSTAQGTVEPASAALVPEHPVSPVAAVRYDPLLVGQLEAEHEVLKTIYYDLGMAGRDGDFLRVEEHLGHFRAALAEHLRKECGMFDYLEGQLADHPDKRETVRVLRSQMDRMAPLVQGRLAGYEGISNRPLLALSLARDMAFLGEVLVARIQEEENTLYPMYAAPSN